MKTLPLSLQQHLDSGTTTLCHCWRLTRQDGLVLGFTDHDGALTFDSVTYEAASGFSATAIETGLGLSVANIDVLGALSSSSLNEAQLAAGLFDNADIEIWRVNWADVSQRVILRKGNLGEVSRGKSAFSAEVRGLAHKLNQPTGRLYQLTCDVDLGAPKCGIDLSLSIYKGSGTVSAVTDNRSFTVTGLGAFVTRWFSRGKLSWTGGANAGRAREVKAHGVSAGVVSIVLWQAMSETVALNDAFDITAGCDKTFETCKTKFSNAVNFRGFPHMPGNDFVVSYPNRGDQNDGGSLSGN